MKRWVQLAAALLVTAAPAGAAIQIVENGILTGATGVNVGGFLYNVAFADGTCAQVFGACQNANFDFTTESGAEVAAQALLDQVFVGTFDSNAALTFGCAGSDACLAAIPYAVGTSVDAGTFFGAVAFNGSTDSPYYANDPTGSINAYTSFNTATTTGSINYVFANFTATGIAAVAPVPEPSTWAMMLMGFGAVGVALRRRKRAVLQFAKG